MKRIITLSMLCIMAIVAVAEENLAVKYRVSTRGTDSGEPYAYEMALVANPIKSLYYNTMSLYVDSCESTPEGKAALHEIQMKAWTVVQPDGTVTLDGRKLGLAPEKKEFLYIEKDSKKGQLTVYDRKAGDLFRYTEPFEEMEWSIRDDSTKNILGFECILARSDYHGRKWTVYFTPVIPVQDGPWKLHGLPGLVMAADGGDDFLIEAIEVGKTSQPVPSVYSVETYEIGERRQILADHEHYINNLESMLAAQGIKVNGDGSPANLPKYNRQRKAWETDY